MKLDPEQVLQTRSPVSPGDAAASRWPRTGVLLAAALIGILALYWDTAASIVGVWASSETFKHGYAIVPIVLFLVWRERSVLARIEPRHDYLGFVLLALAGCGWLVATAGHVQVVQQFGMVVMIPATVIALAGRRAAMAIAFPLAFLLLGVPFGEGLLPRLMDWTANFTVGALRFTGIPVYREGNFFAIPSGQWSVVEACSGLRYLIASLTVGALFAYLNYQRTWKRAVFFALSVAVPIVANFLRAYMIVMIGHVSDMKLAVGVDHFIYGWVFFGIVIGLLFWLGSFWRDPAPAADLSVPHGEPASLAAALAAGCALIGTGAVWPLYAAHLDNAAGDRRSVSLAIPNAAAGWAAEAVDTFDWRPRYSGAVASSFQLYRKEGRTVALYLAYYRDQRPGAELISSMNHLDTTSWLSMSTGQRTEELGATVALHEIHLRGGARRLLVWQWYRIGESELSSPYLAKAVLARDRLLGRGDDSAVIVIATPYEDRPERAAQTLREFGREMRPTLLEALARAGIGGAR